MKADCLIVGLRQREIAIHKGSVTHNENDRYGVPEFGPESVGSGGHENEAKTSLARSTMALNSDSYASYAMAPADWSTEASMVPTR